MKHDVVVIGAGPAGIAAAIQLKRFGLSPVVVERNRIGGLLHCANLVENYPGFPGGISGPDLAALFERQLRSEQIEVVFDEVLAVSLINSICEVQTRGGRYLRGFAIAATGTEPVKHPDLTIPATVAARVGYEVSAVADVRDRHIAIVGGGDAAFDYAARLGKKNRVTIFMRGALSSALPLLQDRVRQTPSIVLQSNTEVMAVESGEESTLELTVTTSGQAQQLEFDYLLFAVGRRPCVGFLKNIQPDDLLEVQDQSLYLVGDVVNGHYRQTAIAVGDGLRVAMRICERLSSPIKSEQVTL